MEITTDWVQTDPDNKQWGRWVRGNIFEFKQDTVIGEFLTKTTGSEIDLDTYTTSDIENCINSFGYSIHPTSRNNINNIYPKKDEALFIIAECLFEQELINK